MGIHAANSVKEGWITSKYSRNCILDWELGTSTFSSAQVLTMVINHYLSRKERVPYAIHETKLGRILTLSFYFMALIFHLLCVCTCMYTYVLCIYLFPLFSRPRVSSEYSSTMVFIFFYIFHLQ